MQELQQMFIQLWEKFIIKAKETFRWNNRTLGISQVPDLAQALEQARREWRYAKLYFNSVTDPDLIDHAVFYMGATEKKYVYLLKRAKETGINVEPLIMA